ncbi:MAG: hypothetical protein ACO3GP_09025, partial [Candidatus Limnocylindrus sp.]
MPMIAAMHRDDPATVAQVLGVNMQPMLQAMAGIASQITEGYGQPSSVVDMLRTINAEQRAEIERLEAVLKNREVELIVRGHELVKAQREINRLQGRDAKPEGDGVLVDVAITPSLSLTVECEFEPYEPPTWCSPEEPEVCEPWSVMIQGEWVLIADLVQRLTDKNAICDAINAQPPFPE